MNESHTTQANTLHYDMNPKPQRHSEFI